ncbi:hypothetical protein BGW39_001881 [Mortierella sp. 14UC]|nr:hypothetical protein BGW39_001881 [Mortierella sp. 14UC]
MAVSTSDALLNNDDGRPQLRRYDPRYILRTFFSGRRAVSTTSADSDVLDDSNSTANIAAATAESVTKQLSDLIQSKFDALIGYRDGTPSVSLNQEQLQFQAPGPALVTPPTQVKPFLRFIDVIAINDELDQLEVRMSEMYDVVDCHTRHSRKPKPLFYKEQKSRFKKWDAKIIHVEVPRMIPEQIEYYAKRSQHHDMPEYWGPELFQRSYGTLKAFELTNIVDGDWVIIADLDEIPKKPAIVAMRGIDSPNEADRMYYSDKDKEYKKHKKGKDITRFDCQWFQMSYKYRYIRYLRLELPKDAKALLIPGVGVRTTAEIEAYRKAMDKDWEEVGVRIRWMRNDMDISAAWDSCWHCTYCQRNVSQILHKIKSYTHQEYNTDEFRSMQWVVNGKRDGTNMIGLECQPMMDLADNHDVPAAINEDRKRYDYALNAHGTSYGGFPDVPTDFYALSGRAHRMIDVVKLEDGDFDHLTDHLKELDPVVDVIVILEAPETQSGTPKPLYFKENWSKFSFYYHKLIYIEMPPLTASERKGEWFIISSPDEIPSRHALRGVHHASMKDDNDRRYERGLNFKGDEQGTAVLDYGKDIYRMPCLHYQQSYEYHVTNRPWNGPVVIRYCQQTPLLHQDELVVGWNLSTSGDIIQHNRSEEEDDLYRQVSANNWADAGARIRELRNNLAISSVADSCWYCSYCKKEVSQVVRMLEEYASLEDPLDEWTNEEWVVMRGKKGWGIYAVPLEVNFFGDDYPHLRWRHNIEDAYYNAPAATS